ncbi:alpha/beta fold hydrolase [Ramlibacter sp. G-1-2-2]|uniref:Alpha/beta fold hydrolase n=1 Tax=Ramlibacter agri TaxID=2728837 RepID=A0A848H301_9BURK|nr:alpha/beta hydrolase [Ramlibacter agri]NML43889.1 alpha/beta fold hydrolase [Ramlibacter agri]
MAILVLSLGACASTAPTSSREVFFAGGTYVGEPGKQVMRGAMYVEHLRPARTTQRYPLVLISGTGQTAVNWMTTPDGRPGWSDFFLARGYEVYLVDQPARGRSAWIDGVDGEVRNLTAASIESLFTVGGKWPQARLHTQWPGSGRPGDPAFDQFYASQVSYLASAPETQRLAKAAGTALLDRIGPAVLVTHSQSGPFGWVIADARPGLVKGIVALEPQGPPIEGKRLLWGLTDIPLTYDPPAAKASDLELEPGSASPDPGLKSCWRQKGSPRQLSRLAGIPVVVLGTEASYHAQFDHCAVQWLQQAGVGAEYLRLEELGIHGNGHMMMLEKNSDDIAAVVSGWVEKAVH